MNNFKKQVPQAIQEKMKETTDYLLENFTSLVTDHKAWDMGEPSLHEIQGNYVSGWMPNQDGGFSIDSFTENGADSSHHFTKKQTEEANRQQTECLYTFLSDNDLLPENCSRGDTGAMWNALDNLPEDQREEFYNYEIDWYEQALYQLQIFIEGFDGWKNEEKGITLRVSINYKDAPYYRERYAEDIKFFFLSVDEYMALDNESILKMLQV